MATLTFIEKQTIYRLFGIEGGYIFSYWQDKGYNKNKTRELLADACGIDIYHNTDYQALSQQKCVEKIWNECSPQTVAKLLDTLCNYFVFRVGAEITYWADQDYKDYITVQEIIKRLRDVDGVELPKQEQSDLLLIVRDIEKNIDAGTPELAVDRLHTFATHFFRNICRMHGIAIVDDKGKNYSLDGTVGQLKKWYEDNDYFESEFCVVALRNTINIFAKFNDIRNDRSAAHPNPLLTKAEAEYAVKIVADTLIFVDKIEKGKSNQSQELPQNFMEFDDGDATEGVLPF